MQQTLTQSGALWELHAWKNSFTLAARFEAQRLKQLRRAIRRQRLLLFLLSSRTMSRDLLLCLRPWRVAVIPPATKALHRIRSDGTVETIANGAVPKSIAIKFRKPEQFSILTICGTQWIVLDSHRCLFWHVAELAKKLQ